MACIEKLHQRHSVLAFDFLLTIWVKFAIERVHKNVKCDGKFREIGHSKSRRPALFRGLCELIS
jgi:hypothetical protein